MKKFAFLIAFIFLLPVWLPAQTTKVRGVVTDADTGEIIPFAGVYFKGTSIGQSTDLDGRFTLETRDMSIKTVTCQLLGYETLELPIKPGQFNNLNFILKMIGNELSGAVVKADNRKIKRLLANMDKRKDKNDPQRRIAYSCDTYSKIELDIANAESQLTGKRFRREMGFVFDYMDTSTVSGVPYLPSILSESVARREHTLYPEVDKETVIANQITGINPDANMLSQFSGNTHLKTNFYSNYINVFNLEFPSPVQKGGLTFYDYFIVDTTMVDARKTYVVRYHPKKAISTAVLDGEMRVDAEDFAIRSVKAKMFKSGTVNWLRDIVLETEYKRLDDGTWFYDKDYVYADFSITQRDSSKLMAVLGKRRVIYTNPSFERIEPSPDKGLVTVAQDANHKDDQYWEQVRPEPLTTQERNITTMVDRVQSTSLYKLLYAAGNTIATNFWDVGPIGFGPIFQMASYNPLEGFRPQIGIHTSKELSKKFRGSAYVAYGCKDHQFKGGGTFELLFKKEPMRKLTLGARYDVIQLGRDRDPWMDNGIFSSLLSKWNLQRPMPASHFSLTYEHEFSPDFNARADIAAKRMYSNYLVPMTLVNGTEVPSIAANELHLQLRFSKDETFNRGHFIKTYMFSPYPVLTLDFTGGFSGIRNGDIGFFRPELSLDWKKRLPPIGISLFHLDSGVILGSNVPYPFLHLFAGNYSIFLDKKSFACMDYLEFAADSWTSFSWNHCFGGILLGKIPLIKHLQLREEFTFRAAYGQLSKRNDPRPTDAPDDMMQLPYGMKTMGKVPYMEIGAGVSNILRVFRVDCCWRLTHLEGATKPFCVTLGAELKF